MTKIKITIDWDTECDGETVPPKELNLPTEKIINIDLPPEICDIIIDTIDIDAIIDCLCDKYGYCMYSLTMCICP